MKLQVAHREGRVPITVLAIDGSVHLGNAAQLEDAARAAIGTGTRNLLIDLTNVSSMTSAGLRVLNVLYKLLDENERRRAGTNGTRKSAHLKLVNPQPRLQSVLAIAGFDTFLEIYPSLDDAIASF